MLLDKLPHAKGAGYLSGNRQNCLRGTRVQVLQDIESWASDPNNRRVYWLNGVAGSGKSAIAQTFSEVQFAEGRLGASFFCSRDFSDRTDIHMIFPTIAFHLAYKYPDFRARILKTIKAEPDVGHQSLWNQVQKLVVEPLKRTGLSTVIVIDALDECQDQEPASVILSLLSRHIDSIPSAKFFITGRPEPRISSAFRLPALRPHTEVLLLHEIERASVDHDIEIYLTNQLSKVSLDGLGFDVPGGTWVTQEEIEILTRKSSGLFIFAVTAVKSITSEHHDPRERLRTITEMPDSYTHEGKAGIDALYTGILQIALGSLDSDVLERFRFVIGSVLLLFNPFSPVDLAVLLNMSVTEVHRTVLFLHSLLAISETEGQYIRVFHKSFPDYMTASTRCRNPTFYVDPSVYHGKLALSCLALMKAKLRRNICSLPR